MAPWQATAALDEQLRAACRAWDSTRNTERLFARDATLWTGGDEARWLDWLDLSSARAAEAPGLALAAGCARDGLTHALLVGMGGSSLCPEVLARVFGKAEGAVGLSVLDSVDPERLRAVIDALDLARVVVIIASKSGSTLEPSLVKDLLLARLRDQVGGDAASRHLVAITDPGSSLEKEARGGGWRAIVAGTAGIGGRYSALSPFGIVPAALLGVDVAQFLTRAEAMRARCLAEPAETNPGIALGLALGTLAKLGRDKMTLLSSPRLRPVGAWIEQLVAESTGKKGAGILPVDLEPRAVPEAGGDDRVFVALRLGQDDELDAQIAGVAAAGHPVLLCDVPEALDLGAAFYQWEIATAVAGSVLGIHPFDQPDVEASKIGARRRLSSGGDRGAVGRKVMSRREGVTIEADVATAAELATRLKARPAPADVLRAHAGAAEPPDWIGLLAWRCEDPEIAALLVEMRARIGRHGRVATTLGFGPRFLHSTGQLHKGGPATGRFIQVMGPASADIAVPGREASFGRVLIAQAEGDFDVLSSRGRRIVLVRLESADAARALVSSL